jgi:hypothetical protein
MIMGIDIAESANKNAGFTKLIDSKIRKENDISGVLC